MSGSNVVQNKKKRMKSVFSEEDQYRIQRTNSWRSMSGVRYIAVVCEVCDSGGGQPIYSCQPKCHICSEPVLMKPAWHSGATCEWDEAVTFYTELDTYLGHKIKA